MPVLKVIRESKKYNLCLAKITVYRACCYRLFIYHLFSHKSDSLESTLVVVVVEGFRFKGLRIIFEKDMSG